MGSDLDERCLFCRIVAGVEPARVVRHDDWTVAFADIAPVAPVHVLIVPRRHVIDVAALGQDPPLAAAVLRAVSDLAHELRLTGFRTVFNTGRDGGQHVAHVHAHVLAGRPMGWPPG